MKSFCIFLSSIFFLAFEMKGANPVLENKALSLSIQHSLDEEEHDAAFYQQRARAWRIGGGVSLGVGAGTALFLVAFKGMSEAWGDGGSIKGPLTASLIPISVSLCAASVPMFIYASKNKKKALEIGAGSIGTPLRTVRRQPALSFRFTF